MKEISEARLKCLNRLLERGLHFKHKKYFITVSFNAHTKSVWFDINNIFGCDAVAIFDFYYDNDMTDDKTIERISDNIIKVLDEIEKVDRIEDIRPKLPFRNGSFIDMDKICRRRKGC